MNRKEMEPYVSHDVVGLFKLLARKKRNKSTFSKSPLRNKIMQNLNYNMSAEEFEMVVNRINKIKELWKKIHGWNVPCFHWQFHPDMYYWYNKTTDSIECDCGLSIPVTLQDEELNERNIRELITDMEYKIYADYKKMGWDIGYWGD